MRVLPKEEIGGNGGSQHRDEQRNVGLAQDQVRRHRVRKYAQPVVGDQDRDDDVDQQADAQHLHDTRYSFERTSDHQKRDEKPGQQRPEPGQTRLQEVHTGSDGHQICSDVQGVSQDENREQDSHDHAYRSVEPLHGQFTEVQSGSQRRAVAYLLHRGHQGKRH